MLRDGEKSYVVAASGVKAGDALQNGPDAPPVRGKLLAAEEHSAGYHDLLC